MPRRKKTEDNEIQILIDGKSIKHIRVDLGIEQSDLARRMGISASTLSRLENGKNIISRPYYNLLRFTIREYEIETGRHTSFVFK